MSLVYGYAGKILYVNLTTSEIAEDRLSEDFCREYVGGAGFSAYYMLSKMQPGIDPFDPESIMCIATGPLAGTFMPSATKAVCSVKGPAGFYEKRNARGPAVLTPPVMEKVQQMLDTGAALPDIATTLQLRANTLAKAVRAGRLHPLKKGDRTDVQK